MVYLSQPAITQAIAKIEASLCVPLFERRSDGMFTTECGRIFLERVERALNLVQFGAKEAVRIGLRRGGRSITNFDQLLTMAQLRALVAVADAGNFTLAARAAGISQPSLHRTARDLERLSGITFFNKSSQGIELTRAAQVLAQQAKLAFGELEQGFDEVEEWRGKDVGSIVVGTMPLARTFILPTAINALTRERPEVRVSVVDGPYNDLLHGLRHGEMDLLIGALRDPPPIDDVVQEPLFRDPLAVVARAGHPLGKVDPVSVEDLVRYPWVVPRRGAPTRIHFDSFLGGAKSGRPASLIESSSLILIRELLLGSDRLTLISAHQVQHEIRMGLLIPLAVAIPGTEREIGLTMRQDWRPTATQRRFLECLREAGRKATEKEGTARRMLFKN